MKIQESESSLSSLSNWNKTRTKPELLLPVGNKEMALAAIHHGADAIFLGVPGFNARGRSADFALEELREIIDVAHLHGVKVNLAFNVLIFQKELEKVIPLLEKILPLGPDAFIIQDLGLIQLIRRWAPWQRIHGSTQMTVTNHESIQLLQDLDIQRFVLGRENSLPDIRAIRQQTTVELEVFVHGALCVSYSGQCFTSEGLGGRSANRGQCAQSCRFAYELLIDGEKKDLGFKKFLLSPQDLCGLQDIPELVAAGVDCFKVEGRLKTPEYVATTAQAYRQALDKGGGASREAERQMAVSYSRGFFRGWLQGVNHQKLVEGTFSSHRGHLLGTIISVDNNEMEIQLQDSETQKHLKAGDGLLWAKNTRDQGGFIYGVKVLKGSRILVELARDIRLAEYWIGARVYQNHDKDMKRIFTQNIEDKSKRRRVDLDVTLYAEEGKPLRAMLFDGTYQVEGQTSVNFEKAQKKGVSDAALEEEFSSLSASVFRLRHFKIHRSSADEIFIPHREIKHLRQSLVEQLTLLRGQSRGRFPENKNQQILLQPLNFQKPLPSVIPSYSPLLFHILLREKEQVEDLVEALNQRRIPRERLDLITLDFEFGRDYLPSMELLRSASLKVGLATTRILKPQEHRNLKHLAELQPDSILVRNLGALEYLSRIHPVQCPLLGDFSLNVTNHLSVDYLLGKGLESLCVSYDLNHQQVTDLLENSPASKLEATVFQYMPSFHMEHCVFAAFLSEGSSYRDCGKPCERHQVQLRDQFGNFHQIKADPECRNTMYNARSQSAGRFLESWKALGLGRARFEALKERGDDLIKKIEAHVAFLQGNISAESLLKQLETVESYGITEGQLGREREYSSTKKM